MNHSAFASQHPSLGPRPNSAPSLVLLQPPPLQHPALAHPAEDDSIEHSLDLSFQQAISISPIDRQIIDNLNRPRFEPTEYALCSGF